MSPVTDVIFSNAHLVSLASFQLIVWLVPSFIASVISITMIGVILGPMYPIAINHTARVLPRHLVNGTVGWVSACAAGGSTFLSYATGEMASKLGIGSLQPSCVFHLTAQVS